MNERVKGILAQVEHRENKEVIAVYPFGQGREHVLIWKNTGEVWVSMLTGPPSDARRYAHYLGLCAEVAEEYAAQHTGTACEDVPDDYDHVPPVPDDDPIRTENDHRTEEWQNALDR